jgi:hypothetical protein
LVCREAPKPCRQNNRLKIERGNVLGIRGVTTFERAARLLEDLAECLAFPQNKKGLMAAIHQAF